jgi:subtilase family serine protease
MGITKEKWTYQIAYLPDLVIQNISFSKNSAYEGETVVVNVRTANQGLASAPSSTTRLITGTSETFFSIRNLSSGAYQISQLNYTCGVSNVYFTAKADYYNLINESNEFNNVLNSSILVCKGKPDLTVSNITYNTYVRMNVTFANVTSTIKNIGNYSSDNSQALNTRMSSSFAWYVPALAPGQTASYTEEYACPYSHYYNVTADAAYAIPETNELNNQMSRWISC